MIAAFPRHRLALAAVATLVGIAASWVTAAPFGLLAPVAGLYLHARGRTAALLNAALGAAFLGSVLAASFHTGGLRELAWSWAAFSAVALCIGAIVAAGMSASPGGDGARAAIRRSTAQGAVPHAGKRCEETTGAVVEDKTAAGAPSSLSLIHPDDRDAAAHAAARAFWTGVPQVTRDRRLQPDGTYRWTETRSEPGYSVSVDIDDLVTEREPPATAASSPPGEGESEVMRSAKVIESLFGNGWAFDAAGRWIYLHPFAQNSLGVTLDDLNASLEEGDTAWKRLLHPDDYDGIAAAWRHCLQTGDHFNVEFRFRRASGTYVWARTAARPARDGRGHITGWFGIALDIDVYKKTVAALRSREQELSQLVDMVPSHLWRLTPEGEPVFFNRRMIDFLGLDLADMDKPGMSRLEALIENIHPDDAAGFREALDHCLATGDGFDLRYRLRRADGAYRWMSSRAEPMRDQAGQIVQWYGLCHDMDDQVHAEEALRRSERELQQLVDALPVHIWSWTPAGKLAYVNKRSMEDLGFSGANFEDCARVAQELVHPEDAPEVLRTSANCLKTGDAFMMRYRRRWKDGDYRWMEGRCEPLRDRDGTIVHWYQVSIDIDDEMRAQVALRRSERELQQLIDALPVHIWSWTPTGKLAYVNKRYLDHLGLSQANFEDFTKVIQGLIHPEDSAGVQRTAANCLKTGEPFMMRYRRRSLDGGYRWMEGRSEPLRDQDGTIVRWYHVTIDIDDAVRAQEELRLAYEDLARQSQAASLAELSASIAHEVNQPLAAIVANSHACQRWLKAETPNIERAQKTVERIIRDANSAADVVGRIRALFKRSVETRSHIPFDSVVAETRELLADELLRRRVRMDVDVEKDLPLVTLDRVQIQQVLINLIRNGMDAMDQITGDKILGVRVRRYGEVIQTEIRDRGRGIAFPQRIFEPFFTTKEHGMGMGLSICRSIVESHGGRLWAEKNEPQGAAFVFTLPAEVKMAP